MKHLRILFLLFVLLLAGAFVTVTGQQRTDFIGTVNAQTGTTYTFVFSDRGKLVTFSNASPVAVTLPQATGSFRSGWTTFARNLGAGAVTITPTTSTINGGSSLVLATGESAIIFSNGSNYLAVTTISSGGGGGSGVTTTGSPSNGNLTKFSGATTITNADLTGDVTTSGGVATTLAATATTVESRLFCSDAGANDTYACNLSPAIASYVTGTHYRFKANTANTGAATLNLNSLGAVTIKKAEGGVTTDLADNDIRAGQWVDVVHDGTNFQMQSNTGNASAGGGPTINATDNVIPYRSNSTTFADSPFIRFDANVMEQRNGTNNQKFNIFNTWTSSTVNAGLRLGIADSGGTMRVGTFQGSGGGAALDLSLRGGTQIQFLTGTSSETLQWEMNTTNFQPSNDNTDALCGEGKRCTRLTLGTGGLFFFDNATNTESPAFRRVSGSIELADNDNSNFTFLKDAGRLRVSTQFDKTNTTLATVTGLTSQNLKASTPYSFEATLVFDADATGGHKYAITGTATATSIYYDVQSMCNASSTFVITSRQTALNGSVGQAGCTAGTTTIKGMILVNAAGTISVQFAQNAANGTSSVLILSAFRIEKF